MYDKREFIPICSMKDNYESITQTHDEKCTALINIYAIQ